MAHERYQALYDHGGVGLYVHDLAGHFVDANDAALHMLGRERDEIHTQSFADLLDEQGLVTAAQTIATLLQTGHARAPSEYRLRHRDGRVVWAETEQALLHRDGQPYGVQGIVRDITERKMAEARLSHYQDNLRALNQFALALSLLPPEGDLPALLTKSLVELTGALGVVFNIYIPEAAALEVTYVHTRSEIINRLSALMGKNLIGMRSPVSAETLPLIKQSIVGHSDNAYDMSFGAIPRATSVALSSLLGFRRYVGIALMVEDVLTGTVAFVLSDDQEDTSDDILRAFAHLAAAALRRQKEQRLLHESEELFRGFYESAVVGLYRTTPQGRIIMANATLVRLLGYDSFAELVQRNLEAEGFSPAHPRHAFRQQLEREGSVIGLEGTWLRRDGTPLHVHESARVIRDAQGQPLYYDGTVVDASDLRRAEEARLEMERQLLHTQKLESLGVLAGGIAHDFNNLLMAILGNLDMAVQEVALPAETRLSLDAATRAAWRAADLTRQMLAYSGRGQFVIKLVNLTQLVEENARMLRAAIPKTAMLALQLGHVPGVMADPSQVQQVVMNLITNAAEALGDKAGEIRLTTRTQLCDEALLRRSMVAEKPTPGRFVVLEVADNGQGMDEATLQRLFEPFFTTKATGRGLGMAAVQGIVRGHHGAILIETRPGLGTTIQVLLPVAVGAAEESGEAERPAPATSHAPTRLTGTVLVADDEAMVLQICTRMLERLGLRVLTAADGAEAVQVFRDHLHEIDGVILDLTMPRLDGIETFHALQELQPQVRVLLSSGYSQQENAARFVGQGLAGFLQKPYELESLRQELARVLQA